MGFKQLPLLYSQKHLRNSMKSKYRFKSNHHTHGLSERLARKIPELLNDPVLVYNSPANPNRICVVLNGVDMDGYPLFAAIEPDGNTDGRIGWLPEFADVKVDDTHGIESKSSTYAYLIKMMDKNGSGWCFGDTKSIAETAHSFKLDKELEIDAVMRSDQENRCIAHDDSKDDPGNR